MFVYEISLVREQENIKIKNINGSQELEIEICNVEKEAKFD